MPALPLPAGQSLKRQIFLKITLLVQVTGEATSHPTTNKSQEIQLSLQLHLLAQISK